MLLLIGRTSATVDKIVDVLSQGSTEFNNPSFQDVESKDAPEGSAPVPRQVRYQAALRPDICCFLDFKPLSQFPIPAGLPKSTETPGFAPYYSAGLNSTSIEIEDPKQIH